MSISTNCYLKKTDFVTREIAGETIIVPVRGNVGDLSSIYTLNEIGTKIWELIDGKKSVEQIVEAICNAYEVTPDKAIEDIVNFLHALEQGGLINTSEEKKD
jgi:hypothetical protein